MAVHQQLHDLIFGPILILYNIYQWALDRLLAPTPPPPNAKLGRRRIAVIGAGLTGVSAASHCVGHGFDVCIFEAGDSDAVGGIWAKVNTTSGLQIHSIEYRFHPKVHFNEGYPKRNELVEQVRNLWHAYGLEDKTVFNTKVNDVYKDAQGRWIVNNPSHGRFDGVICAIGTCGDPKTPHISGQEQFKGEIYHSSRLDGKDANGKTVLIIGGGASAVEALEYADASNADKIYVLARSEKWIIPRNAIIDGLLALNIFGEETIFSWIPESLLRIFFYRDLADISPPKGSKTGLFTETPMVNSRIFDLVRSGKAKWLRGDIQGFEEKGIRFNHRAQGVPKSGPGREELIEGDICIMATGYKRPSLSFLPNQFFQEPYQPPNWYLQVFPPWDPTVCCNNCTYVNAIGTVGNFHIGIYTRFLLMFLTDPLARPRPWWMMRWIDMTKLVKRLLPFGAQNGGLEFFTYAELIYWFLFSLLINPFRWKWLVFVLFGVGPQLPMRIVEDEDRLREQRKRLDVNGHD